ncbi:BRCA1-associated RING domain protein 1 [Amia ocellicauda]|uniref:BRCA1-associated RING domain protein 1 n=1 Tax=Amia ocellicauda TaxID=2972642 RepID=UPI0034645649
MLRGCSANQASSGPADRRSATGTEARCWTETRLSVERLRDLLLCSKCDDVLSQPVCLGGCEHVFCRSCAGACVSEGCSVCHSPVWVKDIQIHRQLDSITQLYRELDALIRHEAAEDPVSECRPPTPEARRPPLLKHKKNFRIWFSPRSRKVRCQAEEPERDGAGRPGQPCGEQEEKGVPEPPGGPSRCADVSVFDFSPSNSSQGSCATPQKSRNRKKTPRKPAPRRKRSGSTRVNQKKRLEDVNREWGFQTGIPGSEGEGEGPPRRVVSFLGDSPLEPGPLEEPGSDTPARGCRGAVSRQTRRPLAARDTPVVGQDDHESGPSESLCPQAGDPVSCPSETGRPGAADETPCTEPAQVQGPVGRALKRRRPVSGSCPERSPKRARTTGSSPRTPASSRLTKESISGGGGSPPPAPHTPSTRTPQSPAPQGSPAAVKRNHMGETALHLAAIKGDVSAVQELLSCGVDPNLKDHAGWTPLHEACNHGHQAVVEVLLQQGALLNTPGYQNDSPLHDAVRNGHTAIARVLLERGASQSVVNIFGLRPVDYAETAEMKAVLESAPPTPTALRSPLSPTSNVNKAPGSHGLQDRVTVLGSRLTKPQLAKIARLGRMLGARQTDAFSSSVTHMVVPDAPMPTTLSCLLGLLGGCWILRFQWVEDSLKAGVMALETEYEAGEGPQRSRLNRENLLPRLFDGCLFFFLGSFQQPGKADLARLVQEGGGRLLSRQPKPDSDVTQTVNTAAYHAAPGSDQASCTQYVLYDPRSAYRPARIRLGKVWSAPSSWLLDCIAAFRLLPVPEPKPGTEALRSAAVGGSGR